MNKDTIKHKTFDKNNNLDGLQARLSYLESNGISTTHTQNGQLNYSNVANNIEAFIGASQIPVGIVGPIVYADAEGNKEEITTFAATTEGALIASMNRGAALIRKSGGFSAYVKDKVMLRAPIFCFNDLHEAQVFTKWLENNLKFLQEHVKQFSRYARLKDIKINCHGRNVDCKFYYETGDASGQNMTTNSTWQACLWIEKNFNKNNNFKIRDFYLEANGSSDKKASYSSINHGRGTSVVADCIIPKDILYKVLHVSPDELIQLLNISRQVGVHDGMIGNNVNIANAIAAIFTATGQDIASVHESSIGVLHFEKQQDDLYVTLNLPNLVVGTVGGGTALPTQKEALQAIGCYGSDKVERLAKLIAGFCMGLELSTMAAIITGEFVLAHEIYGRNKPGNTLSLEELVNNQLVEKNPKLKNPKLVKNLNEHNGIISNISAKVSNKKTGFSSWSFYQDNVEHIGLLKRKPSSDDTSKAMLLQISKVAPRLIKIFLQYVGDSEFNNTDVKEVFVANMLKANNFAAMPCIYAASSDVESNEHLILQELINKDECKLFNSEDTPEKWTDQDILNVMRSVLEAQQKLASLQSNANFKFSSQIDYAGFYQGLIAVCEEKLPGQPISKLLADCLSYLITNEAEILATNKLRIIHNDLNPRNIAIKDNGDVKIYDWELSALDIAQRDFMELICFTQTGQLNFAQLQEEYFVMYKSANPDDEISYSDFVTGCKYAYARFVVMRFSLYLAGEQQMHYSFFDKLFNNILLINQEEKYFA